MADQENFRLFINKTEKYSLLNQWISTLWRHLRYTKDRFSKLMGQSNGTKIRLNQIGL